MTTALDVKTHLAKMIPLDERKKKLTTGYVALIDRLPEPDLNTLLEIKDKASMIATLNSWVGNAKPVPAQQAAAAPAPVPAKKKTAAPAPVPAKKKAAPAPAKKKTFFGSFKPGAGFWISIMFFMLAILALFGLEILDTNFNINFQKASGGQRVSTEYLELIKGTESISKWDWSVFKKVADKFDGNNLTHVFAMLAGMIFIANVVNDARDNDTGGNWAAVFGPLIFVFAFATTSTPEAAAITFTACMVQWRDKDSYQAVWVAPALLGFISLSLRFIGENYLSWSTENLSGAFRSLFHLFYNIPNEWRWIACYLIIIGFTVMAFIAPKKARRDTSGQAGVHILLSLYTVITGNIPFTSVVGVFVVPTSMMAMTGISFFAITNGFSAFLLELKEIGQKVSGKDNEAEMWVGILNFLGYSAIAGFFAFLLSTNNIINVTLFNSILLGLVFPTLFLGILMSTKKVKDKIQGVKSDSIKALRKLIEGDMAGFWRLGPVLIPNTYAGVLMIGIYNLIIVFEGFATMLSK